MSFQLKGYDKIRTFRYDDDPSDVYSSNLVVCCGPTGTLNILSAYAEPNIHSDLKEKSYAGEGGNGATSQCFKDSGFLSSCENVGNVNKDAREACED